MKMEPPKANPKSLGLAQKKTASKRSSNNLTFLIYAFTTQKVQNISKMIWVLSKTKPSFTLQMVKNLILQDALVNTK